MEIFFQQGKKIIISMFLEFDIKVVILQFSDLMWMEFQVIYYQGIGFLFVYLINIYKRFLYVGYFNRYWEYYDG